MKILVVVQDFPWPMVAGPHLRLATVVTALAELGDLDLFSLVRPSRAAPATLPSDVAVARFETAPYPPPPGALRWRARWLARRGVPWEVVKGKLTATGRPELERFARPPYDFVWFSTAALYGWMGMPDLGPTVIDLDNLESSIRRSKIALTWSERPRRSPYREGRLATTLAQDRVNARDWSRYEGRVARKVARVTLCFDEDADRSGFPNAVVIPNAYVRPAKPLGRPEVSDPPVVLFQGSLDYMPNVDGASWFVSKVLPLLQSSLAHVQFRLVGTPSAAVKRLHDPPAVTVVGRVDAMEDELAKADLAIVPIRYGGGTRLKILEAFAHRLPVVSTTAGAEGLRVDPGVHLMTADVAQDFADACQRALTDTSLRRTLVDAAEQRYLEQYEGSVVRRQVVQLACEVASAGDDG